MKYTVLLLRPDYVANNYGEDTYLAHVEADTPEQAEAAGQRQAFSADYEDLDDQLVTLGMEDYYILALFEGHLNDLAEH